MDNRKASLIRARFVRRFSEQRLFEVKTVRVSAWQKATPNYYDRQNMTIGLADANREAVRYWTAYAVDHADPFVAPCEKNGGAPCNYHLSGGSVYVLCRAEIAE